MQTTDEMIAVFIQSSVSQLDLLQIVDGISWNLKTGLQKWRKL